MGTTVLIPKSTHVEFDIPEELVGKELEITFTERKVKAPQKSKSKLGDFVGILSSETANGLREHIKKSRDEWERDI